MSEVYEGQAGTHPYSPREKACKNLMRTCMKLLNQEKRDGITSGWRDDPERGQFSLLSNILPALSLERSNYTP